MKTNYVPALITLLAGAVYCIFGLLSQAPLTDFTVQLLIVLLIFYILGGIIRMILDRFMGEVEVKTEEEGQEDESEKSENAGESESEAEDVSEESEDEEGI